MPLTNKQTNKQANKILITIFDCKALFPQYHKAKLMQMIVENRIFCQFPTLRHFITQPCETGHPVRTKFE